MSSEMGADSVAAPALEAPIGTSAVQEAPASASTPTTSPPLSSPGPMCQGADGEDCSGGERGPGYERLVNALEEALAGGRLFQAHKIAKEICTDSGCDYEQLARRLSPQGIDLELIRSEVEALSTALQQLQEPDGGWHQVSTGQLQGWYKQDTGARVHSLKFTAPVDGVRADQLLACVREFDLIPRWNRYCTEARVLHEAEAGLQMWVYGAGWLPYPFREPDSVMRVLGWDIFEEHGCYAATVVTVDPAELPGAAVLQVPRSRSARKHLDVKAAALLFKPLPPAADGSPRSMGAVVAHMDPQLPMVPSWLVEFVAKVLAPFVYRALQDRLRATLADDSSEFGQRMLARPLYQQVQQAEARVLEWQQSGKVYPLDALEVGEAAEGAVQAAGHKISQWLSALTGLGTSDAVQ